jgi:hypothetical protein
VAGGGDDGAVHFWDVATGEERRAFGEPGGPDRRVLSIALAPDSRTLAAGYDQAVIRLWETASGQERARYQGHRGAVTSLAFSADGALLASGGTDRTAMIWDVTGRLTGSRPRPAGLTSEKLSALWSDLADADAARAYRAEQVLFGAGEVAVSFLRERLRPAAAVDAKRVDRLIADLDSEEFAAREKAARELEELGDAAEPALRRLLGNKPSAEASRRAEALLERLDLARSPERLRVVRALEVLEHAATPEAKKLLGELAKGAPDAWLTREAKATLERLNKQPRLP